MTINPSKRVCARNYPPLVEFALKGNLLDSLDGVLKNLGDYRDSVDKFYLRERKNIYQKFIFQAGGDLQEKFETESELYKLAEKFQRDLQEIIFSSNKTEERIFLLRWAEPLLNISIGEISNFIRDKELDAISEEVLTQFSELRRQNFTAYIADSKSYGEAVQRREKEFNALIFRMRSRRKNFGSRRRIQHKKIASNEIYSAQIRADMERQGRFIEQQMDMVSERQNLVLQSFLSSKEKIIEQTGQITQKIAENYLKRLNENFLPQGQESLRTLPNADVKQLPPAD